MRVLVADDDEDIRFLVSTLLAMHGWEVATTVSGEESMAVLERGDSYDALVLDQNMAPGTGTEVAQRRRAVGDRMPIVLFTGYAAAVDRGAAEAARITVLDKADVIRLPDLLSELVAS